MTQTVTPNPTRSELEADLVKRCWQDPAFLQEMVHDPKTVIEKATGRKLPVDLKIFVHQEDGSHLHLTIPAPPPAVAELSDDELERVAGGTETVILSIIVTVGGAAMATGIGASIGKSNGW